MPTTLLSEIELKVLEISAQNIDQAAYKNPERSCRVCLESRDEMDFLFLTEDNGEEHSISFADQINQCSDIPEVGFFTFKSDGLIINLLRLRSLVTMVCRNTCVAIARNC